MVHSSTLSVHVRLRGPRFLFRLSCRADTPQTPRPTRIHKHNKQWRLSSSSFIPWPKNTHTRGHAHAPVPHTNRLSLRNANAKKSLSVIHRWGDKWTETLFICLIYCAKSTLQSHCVHRSASYTCPPIIFLHGFAGVFTSSLTHYLHIMPERMWV